MFMFKNKCITPLWGRQELCDKLCDIIALSDLLCLHDTVSHKMKERGLEVAGVEIWKSRVKEKIGHDDIWKITQSCGISTTMSIKHY